MFRRRKAHCFELSCYLCSLLIGLGYDAYVVSGYASQDVCTACLDREDCPYVTDHKWIVGLTTRACFLHALTLRPCSVWDPNPERPEVQIIDVTPNESPQEISSDFEKRLSVSSAAYNIQPFRPAQFSLYDQKLHNLNMKREILRQKNLRLQERAAKKSQMRPPEDPLLGQRVHGWVLVCSGKREIRVDFFIEPTTGQHKSCHNDSYLGIESVWNDANLWINYQICSEGVKDLRYDVWDTLLWECFLPYIPAVMPVIKELNGEQLDLYDMSVHELYDMPPSWIVPVTITSRDLQDRYPYGQKLELYKFVKVEKFAPYRTKDGVLMRLHHYQKWDRQGQVVVVEELFQRRSDKMHYRLHDHTSGMVTEYFMHGEPNALLEHTYDPEDATKYSTRLMTFNARCRADGLMSRSIDSNKMVDCYKERRDFLIHRQTWFGKPVETSGTHVPERMEIVQIYEKYDRDPRKGRESIYEITYDLVEEKIKVVYHVEGGRFTRSWRLFKKQRNLQEHANDLFDLNQLREYRANPQSAPLSRLDACLMLTELNNKEILLINKIRQNETEVSAVVAQRLFEQSSPTLYVSPYNTAQNDSRNEERIDLMNREMEDQMNQELKPDLLLPYIVRQDMDPNRQLGKGQMQKVVNTSIIDYKQQLMDRYYIAYNRYEKTSQELKQLNEWYRQNLPNLSHKEVEQYEAKCADLDLKIKITEFRLQQHKESAPVKYLSFEKTVRSDKHSSYSQY